MDNHDVNPRILLMYHRLLNKQRIRNDIDPDLLEKEMIQNAGGDRMIVSSNLVQEQKREINEYTRRLGIKINDSDDEDSGRGDHDNNSSDSESSSDDHGVYDYWSKHKNHSKYDSHHDDKHGRHRHGSSDIKYSDSYRADSGFNSFAGGNVENNVGGGGRSIYSYNNTRTLEQQRRGHIDSVISTLDTDSSFFDQEAAQDGLCADLEEIDELTKILRDEKIDLSRIPVVDNKSDPTDVRMVCKILRRKYDRIGCGAMANEGLMCAASALEDIFDGKRTWFGKWSPDLTDWSKEVQRKLPRIKFDTGRLTASILRNYNIGPGLRILAELVPNMFLHGKNNSAARRKHDGMTTADDAGESSQIYADMMNS